MATVYEDSGGVSKTAWITQQNRPKWGLWEKGGDLGRLSAFSCSARNGVSGIPNLVGKGDPPLHGGGLTEHPVPEMPKFLPGHFLRQFVTTLATGDPPRAGLRSGAQTPPGGVRIGRADLL